MIWLKNEVRIGHLNKRQLCVRWRSPILFCDWRDHNWTLNWRKMFSVCRWWRLFTSKYEWSFWWKRYPHASHRCYCRDGWMFDGNVRACGWSLTWFYSHFWGKIPCVCDQVMAEMYGDDDE